MAGLKISVNAPSYRRADGVKTLSYLPFCKIWVDQSEYDAYKKANPKAKIIGCPPGVQGNLCRVRNYILREEFAKGADVVLLIDDDLQGIERFDVDFQSMYGYERVRLETKDFLMFIEKYSRVAMDLGAKLWGINMNADSRSYRHYTPFNTIAYIGGPFQCFLKGNRCFYDEALPLKEDYDMTLQQLNVERKVFRVNAYHYLCDQSKSPGGCATYRNRLKEQEQFELLQRKWGTDIVRRDTGGGDHTNKKRVFDDYNPVIYFPIRGV